MTTPALVANGLEMGEDEYLETLAHSGRFEFTNGVVTAKRGPYMTQKYHVIVAEEVGAAFRDYRKAAGGFSGQTPTTDLSVGSDRMYRLPDIAYWRPDAPVGDSIFHPPTAGVEVVSPDQSVPDLRRKCRLYLSRGVGVVWLIHPTQRWVEVFDAAHDGTRVPSGAAMQSPLMPGFGLLPSALFGALDDAPA